MDQELLGIIKTKLPNLKDLDISFKQDSLQIILPEFHFDELSTLQIRFNSSTILDSFPISTGIVKKLILNGEDLNVSILKFIEKHANVNVLQIRGEWNPTAVTVAHRSQNEGFYRRTSVPEDFVTEIIRLVPKLPYLNELHIPYTIPFFQPGEMRTLLSLCKVLRKLVIQANDVEPEIQPEYKEDVEIDLQSLLTVATKWKIQFTDDWDFRRFILTFTK